MPDAKRFKISSFLRNLVTLTLLVLLPLAISSCKKIPEIKADVPKAEKAQIDYFAWDAPRTILINGTEYVLIDDYVKWVPILYRDKNFASLEQHISTLLAEQSEENANDLNVLYNVLGHLTDPAHQDLMASILDEWCQQSPSQVPWIVRGYFHISTGWAIRGGDWASTVTPLAMSQFKEQLVLARSDFEKAYTLNPNDPNSSTGLLIIARALSLPTEEMEAFFQRGISVSPGLADLYRQKLEYLTPKWGGTVEGMMKFAEECQDMGEQYPTVGLVVVAAMVEIQDHFTPKDQNYLGDATNWAIVQQSYERFFARYPDNLLRRFNYAYDALKAGKNQTAVEQFEMIGDRWHFGLNWSSPESFNRDRARAYHNLGIELYQRKLPAVAVGYLQNAISYNPSGKYYHSLALAQWREAQSTGSLQSWHEAEASLIKALELDPELESAQKSLKILQDYLAKSHRS